MKVDDQKLFLASRQLKAAIEKLGVNQPSISSNDTPAEQFVLPQLYIRTVTDPDLRQCSMGLFNDGYYARAVEEAFKCLNNYIKNKANIDVDGAPLMQKVFSPKAPRLKLNKLRSISDLNEQNGYMQIFAGSMIGIRNPRAHEHELQDHPEITLELLGLANHLMRKAKSAIKARRPKRK